VLKRCRQCGTSSVEAGGVSVGVKANPDGTTNAAFSGLATCASVWSCPQCAVKIANRRGADLADVIRAVDAMGGSAHMLSLTMKHSARDRLGWDRDERRRFAGLERRRRDRDLAREIGAEIDEAQEAADALERDELMARRGCWDALSDGWAAATSGGTWVKDQKRCGGFLGWTKVVEVTFGRRGPHVHLHALLAFAGQPTDAEVRPIAERMFERWQKKLQAQGYDTSGDMAQDGKVPGWDLRRAQLGDNAIAHYFLKLANEVTGGHAKVGRRPGGLTPFGLAAVAAETYRYEDVVRWQDWQAASDGRQQMTTSGTKKRGNRLRDLVGLDEELTDEEIADERVDADQRLRLSCETWGWLRTAGHVTTALDIAEVDGLLGLATWLDEHGQTYVRGQGLEWVERPPDTPGSPFPIDQGTGRGHDLGRAAILRGRDPGGRPLRRPSDRPPRWTVDARAALPDTGTTRDDSSRHRTARNCD